MAARGERHGPLMRSLGGRTLLFSEERQALFELDPEAASIWAALDGGASEQAILSTHDGPRAGELLEQLAALCGQADGRPAAAARRTMVAPCSVPGLSPLTLDLGGARLLLLLDEAVRREVTDALGHLAAPAGPVHGVMTARVDGGAVVLAASGRDPTRCGRGDYLPLLKGELLDAALAFADYELALHTAALVKGGRLMLLCGAPGAGKTVLAMALVASGWTLAADDVVLVDGGGARGLAFPFAAKAPAWPLVARFWPEAGGAAHVRPDGQVVRYFPPAAIETGRLPLGAVVLLDRQDGARARWSGIDPTEALAALIGEATARDERLSRAGFEALVGALGEARCGRLAYDGPQEAALLLGGLMP